MNIWVVTIIVLVAGLVALLVLSRFRGLGRGEKTTVDRRSGKDRRSRRIRVPVNRRRRDRRAEDAAKSFVDILES